MQTCRQKRDEFMTIMERKSLGEQKVLEADAASPHGNGTLCITNKAIAFEVHGKGIYLNFIPHSTVIGFYQTGLTLFGAKKFRIVWMEGDTRHHFDFRIRRNGLEKIIAEIRAHFIQP